MDMPLGRLAEAVRTSPAIQARAATLQSILAAGQQSTAKRSNQRERPTLQMTGFAISDEHVSEQEENAMSRLNRADLDQYRGLEINKNSKKNNAIQRRIIKNETNIAPASKRPKIKYSYFGIKELKEELESRGLDPEESKHIVSIHKNPGGIYLDMTLDDAIFAARMIELTKHADPPQTQHRSMKSDLFVPKRQVNPGYDRKRDNPMGQKITDDMAKTAAANPNRSGPETIAVFDQTADLKEKQGLKKLGLSRNHILADSAIYSILEKALRSVGGRSKKSLPPQDSYANSAEYHSALIKEAETTSAPVKDFLVALCGNEDQLVTFVEAATSSAKNREYKQKLKGIQKSASMGKNNLRFADAAMNIRILNGFDPDLAKDGKWTKNTSDIFFAVHRMAQSGLIETDLAFTATASSRKVKDAQRGDVTYASSSFLNAGPTAPYRAKEQFGKETKNTTSARVSKSMSPEPYSSRQKRLAAHNAKGTKVESKGASPQKLPPVAGAAATGANSSATGSADLKGSIAKALAGRSTTAKDEKSKSPSKSPSTPAPNVGAKAAASSGDADADAD